MIIDPAAEGGPARSKGIVEKAGTRENGLSTDFKEKMDKSAGNMAALRSGPAHIGEQNGFDKCIVHWG